MRIFYADGFYIDSVHTDIPSGAVEISDELYRELLDKQSEGFEIRGGAGGVPVPVPPAAPAPTTDELLAAFTAAIQRHLDAFARTRNYDGILSAATYATSTVPRFHAEGQYAVEARDAVWAAGYAIMGAVLAGERPMPTLLDVLTELPVLAWPE